MTQKKKKQKKFGFFRRHKFLSALLVLGIFWLGDWALEYRERHFFSKLDKRISQKEHTFQVAELASFDWDYVCYLTPYSSNDELGLLTGKAYSGDDGEITMIFLKKKNVVERISWHLVERKTFNYSGQCDSRDKATISNVLPKKPYDRSLLEKLVFDIFSFIAWLPWSIVIMGILLFIYLYRRWEL